jgi:hypothetical protein
MRLYLFPRIASQNPITLYNRVFNLTCSFCSQAVPLETAKTEEHGLAIHEECYVLKLRVERETGVPMHFPPDDYAGGAIQ